MKPIVLLMILLSISLSGKSENNAAIEFQAKTHDFGELSEGGLATCDFIFTNTGKSPLVIQRVVTSCGCTTPEYPKEPIAAEASASIKVSYNTLNRPGAFHKTITVYSNDPNAPCVVLLITGNVIAKTKTINEDYPVNMDGFRLKKADIYLSDTKIGNVYTETIEVINTNSKPINVSFYKLPKFIQATLSKSNLLPNEPGLLTLRYTPALTKDFGKREDFFFVVTNSKDKENQNHKIRVRSNITEDFSKLSVEQRNNAPSANYTDNRIQLGKMAGRAHKIVTSTLTNSGKSPLCIRKISTEYNGLKVTPEKKVILPGESTKLKIDFFSGSFSGTVNQRIVIITNDPQNSVKRLFLTVEVTD